MGRRIWSDQIIHIVDFEGNLDSGVVELGVVSICEGNIIQAQTRFCRAKQPISIRDTQVHGISTEETLSFDLFDTEWDCFSALRKTGPLGAHHAQYEDMLMRSVWPYCSESPDFLKNTQYSLEWGPWVDSCELYRVLFSGLESYKLSRLVAVFDLQDKLDVLSQEHCPQNRQCYHCALYDALASALLINKLLDYEAVKNETLEWLLVTSMVSQKKRQDHQQLTLF